MCSCKKGRNEIRKPDYGTSQYDFERNYPISALKKQNKVKHIEKYYQKD